MLNFSLRFYWDYQLVIASLCREEGSASTTCSAGRGQTRCPCPRFQQALWGRLCCSPPCISDTKFPEHARWAGGKLESWAACMGVHPTLLMVALLPSTPGAVSCPGVTNPACRMMWTALKPPAVFLILWSAFPKVSSEPPACRCLGGQREVGEGGGNLLSLHIQPRDAAVGSHSSCRFIPK